MKRAICAAAAALIILCGCAKSPGDNSYYSIFSQPSSPDFFETTPSGASSAQDEPSPPKTASSKPKTARSSSPSSRAASIPASSAPAQQTFTETGRYCYDRLSTEQRRIYDIIDSAAADMKSGYFSVGKASSRDISIAFQSVRTDRPEYFWLPAGYIKSTDGVDTSLALDYTGKNIEIHYLVDKQERADIEAQLSKRVAEIVAAAPKTDAYETELFVHDEVCRAATYVIDGGDEPFPNSESTVAGALLYGKAACEGYSRAVQLILSKLSIPCTLVYGYADDVGHMWNLVRLEGEWYHLDATWDDSDSPDYGIIRHAFFNLSDSQIKKTHRLDKDFSETTDEELSRGNGCNLSLPECPGGKMWYAERERVILGDDEALSSAAIRARFSRMANAGENYCEFYIEGDPIKTISQFEKKYSLQKLINDVEYLRRYENYYLMQSEDWITILFQ